MADKNRKLNLTLDDLIALSQPIKDLYAEMAQEVVNNFIDHIIKNSGDLSDEDMYAWQIQKLTEFGLINDENIKIISKYTGVAERDLKKLIEDARLAVYNNAVSDFNSAGKKPAVDTVVYDTLKSYANQVWDSDMKNLVNETLITTNFNVNGGSSKLFNQYRNMINEVVGRVVTGHINPQQAIQETVSDWISTGKFGFLIDKGGHKWMLESYAGMVINSTMHNVFNQSRLDAAREYDMPVARMSSHAAARPACAPIQGTYIYDPRTGLDNPDPSKYPDLSDYGLGEPSGVHGINCRHYFDYFDPETMNPPELTDDDKYRHKHQDETMLNAEKQTQQRLYERNIRHRKAMMEANKQLGLNDRVLKDKQYISNQYMKLKQLLIDNKFLHLDYSRTQFNAANQLMIDSIKGNIANQSWASLKVGANKKGITTANLQSKLGYILGNKSLEQKSKLPMWEKLFGYNANNKTDQITLANRLIDGFDKTAITYKKTVVDEKGMVTETYRQLMQITGLNGKMITVTVGWGLTDGEWRLLSAYVESKRKNN